MRPGGLALFRRLPTAKASFATKLVNPALLEYEPQGRTRIRLSLMPEDTATKLDLRTSRIAERIAFIDPLVEAGYEVHVNLSPVMSRTAGSSGGVSCWLHEVNLGWHSCEVRYAF